MDGEWWGDWVHDETAYDWPQETNESQKTFRQNLPEKGLERKRHHDDLALLEKVDGPTSEPGSNLVVAEPGCLPGDDTLLGTIKFSKDWTKQMAALTEGYVWSECYAVGGGFILDFVGPAALKYEPARNQFPLKIYCLTNGEYNEGHGGDGSEVPGDTVNCHTPQECVEVPSKEGPLEDHL